MTTKEKILNKAQTFHLEKEAEQVWDTAQNAVFITKGQAAKQFPFSYLLGVNSSSKIQKNEKKGYLTGVLYLAAADNVGVSICPKATEGCAKACLFNTGRNSMKSKGEKISRSNKSQFLKTVLFFANRPFFMDWIFDEVTAIVRKAERENKIPAIRLNGTSDITIDNFKNTKGEFILDVFSNVQFYDYTKVPRQLKFATYPNYDVTFSFGGMQNIFEVFEQVKRGTRISVPFVKVNGKFPETFLGLPVIDGDETDLTFLAPENAIYGLKVKLPIGKKLDESNDFFITPERQKIIENMFV